MSSLASSEKPHAVCIPYPAQGHINPMSRLAKLLHHKGFHITFVHTEYNHKRLLRSRGPNSLDGLSDFRFETVPDGLPLSDSDTTQDIPSLCDSTSKHCLAPFRELLKKLNDSNESKVPPVTCIISDGCMSFTIDAAQELGIPIVLFWTTSACGFLGYKNYAQLIERGLTPFKDESQLSNGYLDTIIDWIPGMKNIRLKDLPSFIRSTNPNDIMINFLTREAERTIKASAVIVNTYHALEHDVCEALTTIFPNFYSIGPLPLLLKQIPEISASSSICSNLWKEDRECLQWLETKKPHSVVYVNFGSITVMTPEQMIEFAWGLANSNQTFLWIVRPDLVKGDSAVLSAEFLAETKERGFMTSWCPQEEVLKHPSIGGFLTHSGWNSTIEAICNGVPIVSWPFFAEQQTNCRYSCVEWGIGMEIDNDVKRDEVEKQVRELMEGEKGKEMRNKVLEWKELAEEAANPGGSAYLNLDRLIKEVLLQSKTPVS